MTNHFSKHKHTERGLATEKDIDPAFGLFTEEAEDEAVPHAEQLLEERYPEQDALYTSVSQIEYADVPDADAISQDSEVDPAAPEEEFHGTDLLNGVGRHPEEEDRD